MAMRCLRRSNRRQCPLLGGEVAAFCSSLVEGLVRLDSSLCADGGGGGGAVSMRWCADALRLVKRMQRELLAVFKKAGVPVTDDSYGGGGGGGGGSGGGWFEHYMQETAALLDFCNAFKSAVSRLHRYCMVVDFAAQVGDVAVSLVEESAAAPCGAWPGETEASSAVRDKLSDVKVVVSETDQLGRKILSGDCGDAGSEDGMVVVTLVAKITMAVVSMFVLQALTSPVLPTDVAGRSALGCATVPVPELRPWCETLSVINNRFPRQASVAEHDKVSMAVRDMINAKMGAEREQMINGQEQEMAELLKTRSGELREGVEMFDCVLDEVFDEVIKGRNEMLGIFKDKALT